MGSTSGNPDDGENSEEVPLGTFLFESLSDPETDSVAVVRELREQV